jgi:hypothetical protein
MLDGWSWWQIVATVGVIWTAASFLVALALGRVLRANLAFDVDAGAAPDASNADEDAEEDVGAVWVGPTTMEPSFSTSSCPPISKTGPHAPVARASVR